MFHVTDDYNICVKTYVFLRIDERKTNSVTPSYEREYIYFEWHDP